MRGHRWVLVVRKEYHEPGPARGTFSLPLDRPDKTRRSDLRNWGGWRSGSCVEHGPRDQVDRDERDTGQDEEHHGFEYRCLCGMVMQRAANE